VCQTLDAIRCRHRPCALPIDDRVPPEHAVFPRAKVKRDVAPRHHCAIARCTSFVSPLAAEGCTYRRSVIDFARVLEEARKRKFNVVALDLGLDLSTPQGELVANVRASVAQWERRIIGVRTKEALPVKKAQGVRISRPPRCLHMS
jgi:hypothetical protein